ncbi:MAG: 2-amino-4-hydroxy-6-hydroxymethyldihydropteridine diphosphokinase [Spirochaetia bacterium]
MTGDRRIRKISSKQYVRVFLGIGGNKGDVKASVRGAYEKLDPFLHEREISRLYLTRPKYYFDQPPFINAVITGYTRIEPENLLELCHKIEAEYGRDRNQEKRMGPRPLDIDILLYGSEIISTDSLQIPHPRLTERKFVLIPLLELDNEISHPRTGTDLWKFLNTLQPQGIYYASL